MSLIEIRPPASLEEYQQACSLVETVYSDHGIAAKHRMEHPTANFVAVQDGQVIGSVGFRSADQGLLPVEHFFDLDVATACAAPRRKICEIVKLAAAKRADHAVFKGLIAACLQYGFAENNFTMALAITKPKLEKAITRFLRIPSWRPACQIMSDRAMAENPSYFFENGSPHPICIESKDYSLCGPQLLAQIHGKARVDTSGFDHLHDYSDPAGYSSPRFGEMAETLVLPAKTIHFQVEHADFSAAA